jgi:hypothetical protein
MASWEEFESAAPDLAGAIAARFAAHKHALLATLRRDGAPRISGIETTIRYGDLWLGMMPDSRKGADLRRDPRFALHAAPVDLDLVRAEVTEATLTRVEGDWLVVDSWREDEPPRQRRRQ